MSSIIEFHTWAGRWDNSQILSYVHKIWIFWWKEAHNMFHVTHIMCLYVRVMRKKEKKHQTIKSTMYLCILQLTHKMYSRKITTIHPGQDIVLSVDYSLAVLLLLLFIVFYQESIDRTVYYWINILRYVYTVFQIFTVSHSSILSHNGLL